MRFVRLRILIPSTAHVPVFIATVCPYPTCVLYESLSDLQGSCFDEYKPGVDINVFCAARGCLVAFGFAFNYNPFRRLDNQRLYHKAIWDMRLYAVRISGTNELLTWCGFGASPKRLIAVLLATASWRLPKSIMHCHCHDFLSTSTSSRTHPLTSPNESLASIGTYYSTSYGQSLVYSIVS